jgi:mono/diheme cytochrome c family protein
VLPLIALILVAAAALAAGCGGAETGEVPVGPTPEATPTQRGVPEPQSRGAQVYAEAGCPACHELAGEGNAEPGGALDGLGERADEGEIRSALVDPPENMPSYDGLPPDDLDALVDYLAGLDGA